MGLLRGRREGKRGAEKAARLWGGASAPRGTGGTRGTSPGQAVLAQPLLPPSSDPSSRKPLEITKLMTDLRDCCECE